MAGAGLPGGCALTARQRDVLTLVALGLTNAQAAACLGIARGTLRAHLGVACAALGVPDRTAAAAWWFVHGR